MSKIKKNKKTKQNNVSEKPAAKLPDNLSIPAKPINANIVKSVFEFLKKINSTNVGVIVSILTLLFTALYGLPGFWKEVSGPKFDFSLERFRFGKHEQDTTNQFLIIEATIYNNGYEPLYPTDFLLEIKINDRWFFFKRQYLDPLSIVVNRDERLMKYNKEDDIHEVRILEAGKKYSGYLKFGLDNFTLNDIRPIKKKLEFRISCLTMEGKRYNKLLFGENKLSSEMSPFSPLN